MLADKARRALDSGTDLVEFRIDTLRSLDFEEIEAELSEFVRRCVFTVRPGREAGRFRGSESQRLGLIGALARLRPAFLDVELHTMETNSGLLSESGSPSLIVSWHDPLGTPGLELLHSVLSKASRFGGLVKVVTTASDPADAIRVLSLYDRSPQPPIAFCMGTRGVFSRVMAMELGSPIAYASLSDEPTAAGQLSLSQMLALRRRVQDA